MCGIIGVIDTNRILDPEKLVLLGKMGAISIQHRGPDATGISWSNGDRVWTDKELKQVNFFLTPERMQRIAKDKPRAISMHVRYGTRGPADLMNAQPHYVRDVHGTWSLASNGDIPDLARWRRQLKKKGVKFYSENDAEYLLLKTLDYFKRNSGDIVEAIADTIKTTPGSFSSCLMTGEAVYLFRDRFANRPLWIAEFLDGVYVWSSETCAIDMIFWYFKQEPVFLREVKPGEIIRIGFKGGCSSYQKVRPAERLKRCIFENVYFARPDSLVGHLEAKDYPNIRRLIEAEQMEDIGSHRYRAAKLNIEQKPIPEDYVIISVPASGDFYAVGAETASGLTMRLGIVRNAYVGRTFLGPDESARERMAWLKFNPMWTLFLSKPKVVITEDSIVRGNNLKIVIQMLKKRGAKSVHLRIGCPPVIGSCPYGIDTPTQRELFANNFLGKNGQPDVRRIAKELGADDLEYLTLENLRRCAAKVASPDDYCYACFNREYWHGKEE